VTDEVTTTGVAIFLPMWGNIELEMPMMLGFMMRARGNAIGKRTAPNNPHSPKLRPLFFAIAPVTIPSRRQIQMMVTMIPVPSVWRRHGLLGVVVREGERDRKLGRSLGREPLPIHHTPPLP
jgi:hypothetical protein